MVLFVFVRVLFARICVVGVCCSFTLLCLYHVVVSRGIYINGGGVSDVTIYIYRAPAPRNHAGQRWNRPLKFWF